MKPLGTHNYFFYILTNKIKTVLYIGVTNNLNIRVNQHKQNAMTDKSSFAGKYNCYYLIYWERFQDIDQAIKKEKEIKKWSRKKKDQLIKSFNPDLKFFNHEIGIE